MIKETMIVSGRRVGATLKTLAEITGLNISTVSRRHDAATSRMRQDHDLLQTVKKVLEKYKENAT